MMKIENPSPNFKNVYDGNSSYVRHELTRSIFFMITTMEQRKTTCTIVLILYFDYNDEREKRNGKVDTFICKTSELSEKKKIRYGK